MHPVLQEGEFVFCTVDTVDLLNPKELVCFFYEAKGITIIIPRTDAAKAMLVLQNLSKSQRDVPLFAL